MFDVVEAQPGYRRRIRIEPEGSRVRVLLEDDLHAMAVMLEHAEGVVTRIDPAVLRAPWTTCPGAEAKLIETFLGKPLSQVNSQTQKKLNCTHLHDLAVLAAAHAADGQVTQYDALVSDPRDGRRILLLRRNGADILCWQEQDGLLTEPAELAGSTLLTLRDRIANLPCEDREPARLLQWAGLVAHGRTIPTDQQAKATQMPANCYTFQPERAAIAQRIGWGFDFSASSRVPLEAIDAR